MLLPLEPRVLGNPWPAIVGQLDAARRAARDRGLWAPHLPAEWSGQSLPLASFAEVSAVLGRTPIGHYACNAQAPDVGNMELLLTHGSTEHREQWLRPLAAGRIRSCFAMTEPGRAGSNPVWLGIVGMKRRRGLHGNMVVRGALPPSTRSPSADGAQTGRPAVMEIIGLDLHKRESQLSSKADEGTITDRRIVTSRERFTAVLGARPRARILLEASTESEWVAHHPESLGHEVIVADPNYAPMYANRSRRTKTDKRDARALMDACETGAWRPAYRLSEARRHVRAELAVRDALVRTRTRYIALAKALVRRDGLRVPTSTSARVPTRITELELSPALTTELEPLFAVFAPLNAQIAVAGCAHRGGRERVSDRDAPHHGAGRGAGDGERVRGHDRRHHAVSFGARARGVPRRGAQRAQFGREAAARAHHQSGQRAHAVALVGRRGRSCGRSPQRPPRCGRGRCRSRSGAANASRWSPSRTGSPGSVRDVAGWGAVRCAAATPASERRTDPRGVNGGGPCANRVD